jgi:hypothetical protein
VVDRVHVESVLYQQESDSSIDGRRICIQEYVNVDITNEIFVQPKLFCESKPSSSRMGRMKCIYRKCMDLQPFNISTAHLKNN